MLSSFPVAALAGTILGFLSGIGIGGGSLLILWLTLVLDTPHPQARLLNLLFFIPSALVASLFRWKQGKLPLKQILPAIVTGCLSAFLFSGFSMRIDTSLLRKLFGGLLILTGLREVFYKPKK